MVIVGSVSVLVAERCVNAISGNENEGEETVVEAILEWFSADDMVDLVCFVMKLGAAAVVSDVCVLAMVNEVSMPCSGVLGVISIGEFCEICGWFFIAESFPL